MIRSTLLRGGLAFLAATVLGCIGQAQGKPLSPTDKVETILDKTASVLQQPFECDFALNITAEEGNVRGSGHIAYFSPRMFAGDLKVTVQAPGQMGGGGNLKVVADDSYVFFEVQSPDMPGTQAFKISLDMFEDMTSRFEDMSESMGGSTEGIESFSDFLSQLNFQKAELKNGTTQLTTHLDDVIPAGLPFSLKLALDLDSRTAFPKRLKLDGGSDFSLMFLTNKVDFPRKLKESQFQYQAPQGVTVVDLTAMLEMQLDMMGAGLVEDDF